jgi:F-type H+-transporting ATPase subunit epsilon
VSIELTVVTPQGQAFSGAVEAVVLPGSEGEFGVLESHERFLTALEPGVMQVQSGDGTQWAAISDGFADVTAERVVVMVDSHLRPDEIDLSKTREAEQRVRSELAALGRSEADEPRRAELEHELARLQPQIEVHARSGS